MPPSWRDYTAGASWRYSSIAASCSAEAVSAHSSTTLTLHASPICEGKVLGSAARSGPSLPCLHSQSYCYEQWG